MNYTEALAKITKDIKASAKTYDWVDGPGGHTEGLSHVDKKQVDKSLFTIEIGIPTDHLNQEEINSLEKRMKAIAEEHGISMRVSEASPSNCVYTFNLHAKFLQYPKQYA